MLKKIWESLSSTRLAIVLLIILVVVCVFGVAIPQELSPDRYLDKLGTFFGNIVLIIGLDHTFTTNWFYLLMAALSLNLLAVIERRMVKNFAKSRRLTFFSSQSEVKSFKLKESFSIKGSPEKIIPALLSSLTKLGFRVAVDSASGQIAAKKGSIKDISLIVFHISIILFFVGGLVSKYTGYSHLLIIGNGQSVAVPEKPFFAKSHGFSLERAENGAVKEYKTELSIIGRDGNTLAKKTVMVNDPLTYDGVRFYQTSFGEDSSAVENILLTVALGTNDTAIPQTVTLKFKEVTPLDGDGTTILVDRYLSDFIFDMESRSYTNRSSEPNNPAIHVIISKNGQPITSKWLFQRFPDAHGAGSNHDNMMGGVGSELYSMTFLDYTPLYSTGIQAKKSPGNIFIWIAIFAMTFSLLGLFYIVRKSLWIFVKQDEVGKLEVTVVATLSRIPAQADANFKTICESIKNSVKESK